MRVLVVNAGSSSLKLSALDGDAAVWSQTVDSGQLDADGVRDAVRGAGELDAVGLQAHQVDDVDEPHLQLGRLAPQDVGRGERLERRDVAAARQNHVRLALVVRGPLPDAACAV